MNTPIIDFVKRYAQSKAVRAHMPGHKGVSLLGMEAFDITEIDGADNLLAPSGIISESEKNASEIFSSKTFYSAGGSTLCIQAMLYLTALLASSRSEKPLILAARNAHKSFINAAALLDIDVRWIFPKDGTYFSGTVTEKEVKDAIEGCGDKITAVYITSPDYLGNISDIKAISKVCRQKNILLLVDNAHGAYLKFLPQSKHPMDLGADMCCDSAHKTLPVLTGGAYLHIADGADEILKSKAVEAMSVFSSSSPSYLILQSLDLFNGRAEEFKRRLSYFLPKAKAFKEKIISLGFEICGDEELKVTLKPKSYGYTGGELALTLEKEEIYPEFYDCDHLVLMLSPYNTDEELERIFDVLKRIKRKDAIKSRPPKLVKPKAAMPAHKAMLSLGKILPVKDCLGRVSASSAICCPPAVPIVSYGEVIDEDVIKCFEYYGIDRCSTVK